MKKTILIAPADDASLFAMEARNAGCNIALGLTEKRPAKKRAKAPQGGDEAGAQAPIDEGRRDFPWTPGSFVSSRALIVDAVNAFGGLSYAVLSPTFPVRADMADASPADLQKAIEHSLTGLMLLSRELFSRGLEGEAVRVAYALRKPEGEGEVAEACFEAARAFAEAMAASRPEQCLCILDECAQRELGANFVIRSLCAPVLKHGGKPIRFTGKSGLFGIM